MMENISARIINLVIFLPLFLIAITVHEFAHGYAAYRAGDDTAKLKGRLTLNPIAHIDPMGLVFFFASAISGFGFGWAKPVPVNPVKFKKMRRDDIIVSLAGVAANLLLMILTAIVIKALVMSGLADFTINADPTNVQYRLQSLLRQFFFLNGVLVVFNLIPVPPLDGSHVVIQLFSKDPIMTEIKLSRYGFMFLIILLFTGILSSVVDFALTKMVLLLQFFI